jgi:hypothetical protein
MRRPILSTAFGRQKMACPEGDTCMSAHNLYEYVSGLASLRRVTLSGLHVNGTRKQRF